MGMARFDRLTNEVIDKVISQCRRQGTKPYGYRGRWYYVMAFDPRTLADAPAEVQARFRIVEWQDKAYWAVEVPRDA